MHVESMGLFAWWTSVSLAQFKLIKLVIIYHYIN
jgi:hypothetical protein